MNNVGNILLSIHVGYATLISACFFALLFGAKDELHQYAINKAMKPSVVFVILFLLGYSFYKLVSGDGIVSIHVIFFGIEAFVTLALLLYFLELRGFSFFLKLKNRKFANFLIILSIITSVLATFSIAFQIKLFANPFGIIRYDELVLLINVIFLILVIPLFPNIKPKLTREAYKKRKAEMNKTFNIFIVIYVIFMVVMISYVVYRKLIFKA